MYSIKRNEHASYEHESRDTFSCIYNEIFIHGFDWISDSTCYHFYHRIRTYKCFNDIQKNNHNCIIFQWKNSTWNKKTRTKLLHWKTIGWIWEIVIIIKLYVTKIYLLCLFLYFSDGFSTSMTVNENVSNFKLSTKKEHLNKS